MYNQTSKDAYYKIFFHLTFRSSHYHPEAEIQLVQDVALQEFQNECPQRPLLQILLQGGRSEVSEKLG